MLRGRPPTLNSQRGTAATETQGTQRTRRDAKEFEGHEEHEGGNRVSGEGTGARGDVLAKTPSRKGGAKRGGVGLAAWRPRALPRPRSSPARRPVRFAPGPSVTRGAGRADVLCVLFPSPPSGSCPIAIDTRPAARGCPARRASRSSLWRGAASSQRRVAARGEAAGLSRCRQLATVFLGVFASLREKSPGRRGASTVQVRVPGEILSPRRQAAKAVRGAEVSAGPLRGLGR